MAHGTNSTTTIYGQRGDDPVAIGGLSSRRFN
jgi:hypothetical protein